MSFLYPTFLFALFAVAIPVIIHLFSFRRYKTLYFSNVGFLKDVKKESQKKSRLRQLLMLLARIMAIVFLVFAFSQPYIPVGNDTREGVEEVVGVYIDNSFSMNALSEKGQLLELARNRAAEIGQSYPAGTRFRLFTTDMDPRHQQLLNKEQFFSILADVKPSPSVIPASFVSNRFNILNQMQDDRGTLFFISDFQRSVTDLENFPENSTYNYFLPLKPNQVNNLYIDSSWVEVPAHGLNREETVFIRIKNDSDEDYQNLPLRLFLNDSLKSMTNFSIEGSDEIVTSLKYKNVSPGIQHGRIEISDYPFTHDNTWFISYYVEPRLKALAVFEDNPESEQGLAYISALFENDDYVELEQMNIRNMQISKLAESNTVFLINLTSFSTGFLNELTSAAEKGISVVLFPGGKTPVEVHNQFLSQFGAGTVTGTDTTAQEIAGIDFDNRFFTNVFSERKENALLPEIGSHLKFRESIRTSENNLLWFKNGDRALSMMPYQDGKLWVFAFPLNNENEAFANDILFVPSIYNIVLNSLPYQQLSHTIGKEQAWLLPRTINTNREATIEMVHTETGNRFIPGMTVSGRGTMVDFGGMIDNAGHYLVRQDEETITSLAFNYDRKESDLRYYSPEELQQQTGSGNLRNASVIESVDAGISEVLDEIQKGKQLWKLCILLALFFILAEVLIARFWKQ